MGRYPSGLFVGHKQFVVDSDWLKHKDEQRYQARQRQFAEWSKKYITITRLKSDRLWTDGAIRKWLGEPQQQDKYKVFLVDDVKKAERRKEYKEWLAPRLEKKLAANPHFTIKKIGTV